LPALKALADEGKVERDKVAAAIAKYALNTNKPNPVKV
jgi:pyruvate dehydrogenase E1 component